MNTINFLLQSNNKKKKFRNKRYSNEIIIYAVKAFENP